MTESQWTKFSALRYNGIVWYAVLKHLEWCITLLLADGAFRISALYILYLIFDNKYLAIGLLVLSITCALMAMFASRLSDIQRVILLGPQQFIMWTTCTSVVVLALQGHYADGVARPGIFIFTDQIAYVVGAVAHTGTLILYSWRGKWSLKT